MVIDHQPADPLVHETAIRIARRCRHTIQCLLREDEWRDADREFYLVVRDELERLRASQARDLVPEGGGAGG